MPVPEEPFAPIKPVRRRWAWVWGLAVVGVAADQWTKNWALESFTPGVAVPVVPPALHWNLVFNPGAAFSMGTTVTPLFTGLLALVAVAVGFVSLRVTSVWWACALGLLLGGAVGNLHDRIFRPPSPGFGHVVDFIQLPNFPVFNVADSCICTAAAMMVVATWRQIPWQLPVVAAVPSPEQSLRDIVVFPSELSPEGATAVTTAHPEPADGGEAPPAHDVAPQVDDAKGAGADPAAEHEHEHEAEHEHEGEHEHEPSAASPLGSQDPPEVKPAESSATGADRG